MPPKSTSTPAKGSGPGSTSDIDTIIPLLFAAHPELRPNYRKMATIDEHGRTSVALEHKFRNWRHKAREIQEKFPDVVGDGPKAIAPPTPRKPGNRKNDTVIVNGNKSDEDLPSTQKTGKKRGASAVGCDDNSHKKKARVSKGEAMKTEEDSGNSQDTIDEEEEEGLLEMKFE